MIYLNDEPLDIHPYPNQETCFPRLDPTGTNHLRLHWQDDRDLVNLWTVRWHYGDWPIDLEIEYLPYSRMDRSPTPDVVCSLEHIARLINAAEFDSVGIWEPHSEASTRLIRRSYSIDVTERLLRYHTEYNFDEDALVWPDAGAVERYQMAADWPIHFLKKRDFDTGNLIGFFPDPLYEKNAKGRRCWIMDDLCSKGGTFVGVGKSLRELGATEVHLVVTHLEQTAATGVLFDNMDSVTCSDSMLRTPEEVGRFHGTLLSETMKRNGGIATDVLQKLHIISRKEWKQ